MYTFYELHATEVSVNVILLVGCIFDGFWEIEGIGTTSIGSLKRD